MLLCEGDHLVRITFVAITNICGKLLQLHPFKILCTFISKLKCQNHFFFFLKSTGFLLLGGGVSGCLGVIIFAIWGNKDKWLPEHANNFFGNSIYFTQCCVKNILK